MFKFNKGSGWSLELELECFIILKIIEAEGFPRGRQSDLCKELSIRCTLSEGTIKAKVGNFKAEGGHTGETNSSYATKYIMDKFGSYSLNEARALLKGYQLSKQART